MKTEKCPQAAGAFMRFKRITKENGSIYNSTRERVDSKLMEMEAPSDGLLVAVKAKG